MENLRVPYGPTSHSMDFHLVSTHHEQSLIAEKFRGQNAFDAILPEHQSLMRSHFRDIINKIYRGLQNPNLDRGSVIETANRDFSNLNETTRDVQASQPNERGWAYLLTLDRCWTVLDLVLEANRGKSYQEKRLISLMIPNHYPTLLELFGNPDLHLSPVESEILADICEGAGNKDSNTVIKLARDLIEALPNTPIGKRETAVTDLGDDFIDVLLSIRFGPPIISTSARQNPKPTSRLAK